MNHVMRALIVVLCVQVVHAAEPKRKRARKAARNMSFEHRFSDDLEQTADSVSAQTARGQKPAL